jgi:DNA-binding response OmpR family regulator
VKAIRFSPRSRSFVGGGATSIEAMLLLVIEDETAIADFLTRGLEAEGHTVISEANGEEGQRRALDEPVDMVILDRMLPGRDGIEVLEAIRRAKPTLPVILLTARGEIGERVEGLDRGATDYMTKPFSFEELAARVRAHVRQPDDVAGAQLTAAGIRLNMLTREAERDGVRVSLSGRESDLLAYLMRHAGQIVSRRQILRAVWGYEHDPGTNAVSVYIGYLRRRLALPQRPAPIETVRSVGYRLTE